MADNNANSNNETDLAHADIALVCALPIEISPFLDRCDKLRKYTGGDFTFRGGRLGEIRVVIVECGMGYARARRATQALIDAHSPEWIVSTGFCGGLKPEVKQRQIVMANSIVDTHGQEVLIDLHMESNPSAGLHVGRTVTADELVRTVEEKKNLAAQFDALAVDLESLAVAQVCQDAATKFMAVRAVSDDLSADLPAEILSIIGATGTTRLGAALGSVWKRPSSVKDMWHLREAAVKTSEGLAEFLDGVVVQLYESINRS
jgi:adenosylhomocysteine nucleosidase